MEYVACYLCGAHETEPWATENGYDARRCVECRLIYVTPRPNTDEIDQATRTGSHRTDEGELKVTGSFSKVRQKRLEALLPRLFAQRISQGGPVRWLDIGSGHGELLLAAQAAMPEGSTVVGVEPNTAKRVGAQRRGLVTVASVDELAGPFDVLSLMNVYSHLPDPVGIISGWTSLLAETGELFLETGNGADLPHRDGYPGALDLPDHLSFAGEPQLKLLFDLLGFGSTRIHRARLDGVLGASYQLVRHLRDRSVPIHLPYRSSFRDLFVIAQRTSTGPASGAAAATSAEPQQCLLD